MTRGLSGKAPANLQSHLKGAHYPATKNDLVTVARHNGASSEIIDLIEMLPEERFGGPQDVMRAYGELGAEQRKAS